MKNAFFQLLSSGKQLLSSEPITKKLLFLTTHIFLSQQIMVKNYEKVCVTH